jgi:sugar phosphate isomerase/epimerase
LNAIEDSGFDGFVTVELYTYDHAAEEAAKEAFEYLRQWKQESGKKLGD